MKLKIVVAFLFIFFSIAANARLEQNFDRQAFYKVMKTGDINAIDNEIALIEASSIAEKDAYEGAVLMKKAGLETKAKDKLQFFKPGRIKLETALLNEPDDAEYHFLRLTIEEHAPKAAKYNKDIDADKKIVIQKFKNFSPLLQQVIVDYSQTSTVLNPQDLNPR
jgi:hypothetical protein